MATIITVTVPTGGMARIPEITSCDLDLFDNRTPIHKLIISQDVIPGTCVPCGTVTPITVTVRDQSGNTTTCEVDFRVECGVTFYSEEVTVNCPSGSVGDSITIPAGRYSSTVSQQDANDQATEAAEAALQCCADTSAQIAGNLNSAVYDPVRNVIWGTGTPGHILKFDPDTGDLLSNTFVFGPDWSNDGTICYCPETDRIYTAVRLNFQNTVQTPDPKKLYEINPDTLAITNSKLLTFYDSRLQSSAFGFLRLYSFAGKLIAGAVADNGHATIYIIDPTNLASYVQVSLSSTASFVDVAFDNRIDNTLICVDNSSNPYTVIRAAMLHEFSANLAGTYISPTSVAKYLYGVAYSTWNKQVYLATGSQFIAHTQNACAAVVTIDTGRPNANGYNIRNNPYTFYLYAANWNDNTVTIIDPRDDSIVATVTGFDSPYDIICTPTKTFAVQHSRQGLKEVIAVLPVIPAPSPDPPVTIGATRLLSWWTMDEAQNAVKVDSKSGHNLSPLPGGTNGAVNTLAIQADGNIVIGGAFTQVNAVAKSKIARINSSGLTGLDTSFVPGTVATTVRALAIQADQQILVGGDSANFLKRLGTTGTVDATFTPLPNNSVRAIAVQSGDQKIIVGGTFTTIAGRTIRGLERLNTDGTDDVSWNAGGGTGLGNNSVFALAIDGSGNIIIGGNFTSYNDSTGTTSINRIARILPNGKLDTTFNPGTGADNNVLAIAIQGDGKIVIGGDFTTINGVSHVRLARLNTDGSLDSSFNPTSATSVAAIAIQVDGKIVVAGDGVRLNSNGTTDATFAANFFSESVGGTFFQTGATALAIQGDGKIITGWSGTASAFGPFLSRLKTTLAVDLSFNALGPTSVAGLHGNAASFSVTDGNRMLGGLSSLTKINDFVLDPRQGFTIVLAAKLISASAFPPTLFRFSSGLNCGFESQMSGVAPSYSDGVYDGLTYNGSFQIQAAFGFTVGNWYFMRFWLDPVTKKLHLQIWDTLGVMKYEQTDAYTQRTFDRITDAAAAVGSIELMQGTSAPGSVYAIDDWGIYKGALTDAEWTQLYNGGVWRTWGDPLIPYS